MKKLTELNAAEAGAYFLKGSSYFNSDFPSYISFEPILNEVAGVLGGAGYEGFKSDKPENFSDVNYSFIANKDGRLAWRPLELMHPAVYVSLINLICADENWSEIVKRLEYFDGGIVTCCSVPVISSDDQKDQAVQIRKWWQAVEQTSLSFALEFSHVLHTDVTDCYGSLYTHSISWALHGIDEAKKQKGKGKLLGDKIDEYIRAGRYGQTNGISQGSALMDFIAEIVLGYVDSLIAHNLKDTSGFRILRYRDDYRVFTNNDGLAEQILKVISDCLRVVGMRLGVAKTFINTNVIEGSVKPDKLAGIELQDLGEANAHTLQKQLLRLHSFGRKYPNSGALKRLVGELHTKLVEQEIVPDDLEVQVAIATDIAVTSPTTFPVVAGILTHMISLQPKDQKPALWDKIQKKMSQVPYNGYQEVWLQRVTKPAILGIEHPSSEAICRIVNGEDVALWNNGWIGSKQLLNSLAVSQIMVADAGGISEVISPEEVELFKKNAWSY